MARTIRDWLMSKQRELQKKHTELCLPLIKVGSFLLDIAPFMRGRKRQMPVVLKAMSYIMTVDGNDDSSWASLMNESMALSEVNDGKRSAWSILKRSAMNSFNLSARRASASQPSSFDLTSPRDKEAESKKCVGILTEHPFCQLILDFIKKENVNVDELKQAMTLTRERGMARKAGLDNFKRLIASVQSTPLRSIIASRFAAIFRRDNFQSKRKFAKVHFLKHLDGAGPIVRAVRSSFFGVLHLLLHEKFEDSQAAISFVSKQPWVLDACTIPYNLRDCSRLHQIGILKFLRPLISWDAGVHLVQCPPSLRSSSALVSLRHRVAGWSLFRLLLYAAAKAGQGPSSDAADYNLQAVGVEVLKKFTGEGLEVICAEIQSVKNWWSLELEGELGIADARYKMHLNLPPFDPSENLGSGDDDKWRESLSEKWRQREVEMNVQQQSFQCFAEASWVDYQVDTGEWLVGRIEKITHNGCALIRDIYGCLIASMEKGSGQYSFVTISLCSSRLAILGSRTSGKIPQLGAYREYESMSKANFGWLRESGRFVEKNNGDERKLHNVTRFDPRVARSLFLNEKLWVLAKTCTSSVVQRYLRQEKQLTMLLELAFEGNQIHTRLALRVLRAVLSNVDVGLVDRIMVGIMNRFYTGEDPCVLTSEQRRILIECNCKFVPALLSWIGQTTTVSIGCGEGTAMKDWMNSVCVASNDDLVLSNELVELVRTLHSNSSGGEQSWKAVIETSLTGALQYVQVVASELSLCCKWISPERVRYWRLLGSLSILGGHSEVLFEGCKVKVSLGSAVMNGIVISGHNHPQESLKILLTDNASEVLTVSAEKRDSVVPVTTESINMSSMGCCGLLLRLMMQLLSQQMQTGLDENLSSGSQIINGTLIHLKSILHWKAAKALGTIVRDPEVMTIFLEQGNLANFLSINGQERGIDNVRETDELEKRWFEAEAHRRTRLIEKLSTENYEVWTCKVCTVENEAFGRRCQVCTSDRERWQLSSTSRMASASITTNIGHHHGGNASSPGYLRQWDFNERNRLPVCSFAHLTIATGEGPKDEVRWESLTVKSFRTRKVSILEHDEKFNLLAITVPPGGITVLPNFSVETRSPQYSVIMDVCLDDISNTTVLWAPSWMDNDSAMTGKWVITKDGAVGTCGTSFSPQGTIKAGEFYRLVLSVNVARKTRMFFVNGAMVLSVDDSSKAGSNQKSLLKPNVFTKATLEDWGLDQSFLVFPKSTPQRASVARISSLQVRNYSVDAEDVAELDTVSPEGISKPSSDEIAKRLVILSNQTMRMAWCYEAIGACGNNDMDKILGWLNTNKTRLLEQNDRDAASISGMGYTKKACQKMMESNGAFVDRALEDVIDNESPDSLQNNLTPLLPSEVESPLDNPTCVLSFRSFRSLPPSFLPHPFLPSLLAHPFRPHPFLPSFLTHPFLPSFLTPSFLPLFLYSFIPLFRPSFLPSFPPSFRQGTKLWPTRATKGGPVT
jgi:hypothetical protein